MGLTWKKSKKKKSSATIINTDNDINPYKLTMTWTVFVLVFGFLFLVGVSPDLFGSDSPQTPTGLDSLTSSNPNVRINPDGVVRTIPLNEDG